MRKIILILTAILLQFTSFAQIQKIFNTKFNKLDSIYTEDRQYFGNYVSMGEGYALAQNADFFNRVSNLNYKLHIFKKNEKKWHEIQAFKEYNKIAVLSGKRMIADDEYSGNYTKNYPTLDLLELHKEQFEVVDTSLLYLDINKTPYVYHKAIYGNWVFLSRMFYKIYKKDTIIDYFFHIENHKLILKDSFIYSALGNHFSARRKGSVRAIMKNNFVVLAVGGILMIYKRKEEHWFLFQQIDLPFFYDYIYSIFNMDVSMSPDEKWVAATQIDTVGDYKKSYVNIYKLGDTKWKKVQTIKSFGMDSTSFGRVMNISNDELLIGSPKRYDGKGTIDYYILKEGVWVKKGEIHPLVNDKKYRYFGYSIDRDGETVIVGAPRDNTYPDSLGAVYIFQIPARDTIRASICEGENYIFGDSIYFTQGFYSNTLMSSYGVDSIVHLLLDVHPKATIAIDTALCEGDSINIGDKTYFEEGNYHFDLHSQNGCDSTVDIDIKYSTLDLDTVITANYGCQSGAIDLIIESDNYPYLFDWSNGSHEEDINSLSSGDYSVTITDNSNCEYKIEDLIISDSIPYLIPNIFFPSTPKDDINSSFKIYLGKGTNILSTEIFDRWGSKVFESNDNTSWDGTSRGVDLPPGVYLYKVVINSPCGSKTETGQIMLLR